MKLFCAMYLYIYVHICIYAKRKASHQGIIKSMEIPNISIFFPERVSGGASSGFLMSSCSSCCIVAHFSAFLRVMITCVENYLEQPCCIFLLGLTQATLVSSPPENVKILHDRKFWGSQDAYFESGLNPAPGTLQAIL